MPERETAEVLIEVGQRLASLTLKPDEAKTVAAQLESCSLDLAIAIIRWEDESGSTRESRMARATLRDMDERLLWIQQNREDIDMAQTKAELQAARQSASDILTLLRRQGIDVPEVQRVEPRRARQRG